MATTFRRLPANVIQQLSVLEGSAVEVRALVTVSPGELGEFSGAGLNSNNLSVGDSWTFLPSSEAGSYSRKNREGWEVIRKDLPKYNKTFCHDIQNFGYGSTYGWSTVCVDRMVYHRDQYTPPMHEIKVVVDELLPDGSFGVLFVIQNNFDRDSESFSEDLLFAINLMRENAGTASVVAPEEPRAYFTDRVDWELFPPGSVDQVLASLKRGRRLSPDAEITAKERLKLFEKFSPVSYLRGLGGADSYIGARYADDLIVFENTRYGNALYMLYEDWEQYSQVPRSKLLTMAGDRFDRIVHRAGWENVFEKLIRKRFKERGISLRRR